MRSLTLKVIGRLAAEVREFRRWEALRDPRDLRVYYGMDRLPERSGDVSGGFVKCLDLAARFPNSAAKANLLYLVSSALPALAVILLQIAVTGIRAVRADWRSRDPEVVEYATSRPLLKGRRGL